MRRELESPVPFVLRPMDFDLTNKEQNQTVESIRTEPKQQRNNKCSCGSGKKYKHCCLIKTK
jgi:uncharacterized protein YecA (UPF0149 family)